MKYLDVVLKALCVAVFIMNISTSISLLCFGLFCLLQQSSLTILSLGAPVITHSWAKDFEDIIAYLDTHGFTHENTCHALHKKAGNDFGSFKRYALFLSYALSWKGKTIPEFQPSTVREALLYLHLFPNKNLTIDKIADSAGDDTLKQKLLDVIKILVLGAKQTKHQTERNTLTSSCNNVASLSINEREKIGFDLQSIYALTKDKAFLKKELNFPQGDVDNLPSLPSIDEKGSFLEGKPFRVGFARNLETQITYHPSGKANYRGFTWMLQLGNQYKLKFKTNFISLALYTLMPLGCLFITHVLAPAVIPVIVSLLAFSVEAWHVQAVITTLWLSTLAVTAFLFNQSNGDFITLNLGHHPLSPGGHFFRPNPEHPDSKQYSLGVITLNILITAILALPLTLFGAVNIFSLMSPYLWILLTALTICDRSMALIEKCGADYLATFLSYIPLLGKEEELKLSLEMSCCPCHVQKIDKTVDHVHSKISGLAIPSPVSDIVHAAQKTAFLIAT